ncbi:IS4 family transposase [Streptomyces sp. NPDC053076]|uniref:IS4 family transposase n=1 Tax=Streptomyces sp. NPDC053076 TaxID=3365696 RepID=UPI0037CDDFBC
MPRPGQVKAADEGLSDRLAIGLLVHAFPPDLVDHVVAECGRAERRSRLLPARAVVYFVLAMCLFSRQSYAQVARLVAEGLAWAGQGSRPWPVPTTAAISRARARLGPEPLAALFAEVASPARPSRRARPTPTTTGTEGERYRQWRLLAIDGTSVGVPDSVENRARYGPPPATAAGRPAFTQVHVVALAECGTHAITRAALGRSSHPRHTLTRELLGAVAQGDLLLADHRFTGIELIPAACASGADLLWGIGPWPLPVRAALPDGSYLCDLVTDGTHRPRTDPPVVRVIEAARDATGLADRLVTTVLDHEAAPSHGLAALYRRRWEIEASLDTLGALRRGAPHVLRSRWPAGVEQELWGHLLIHHTIRSLLHSASRP